MLIAKYSIEYYGKESEIEKSSFGKFMFRFIIPSYMNIIVRVRFIITKYYNELKKKKEESVKEEIQMKLLDESLNEENSKKEEMARNTIDENEFEDDSDEKEEE